VFLLDAVTDLDGLVLNGPGVLTHTNYVGVGEGFTISDAANMLVFPMMVMDAAGMSWLLSTGGGPAVMKHVSTSVMSARDMIFHSVRTKVGARASFNPLASKTFDPIMEGGEVWFASHVMLNNSVRFFKRDPDSTVGAVSRGLASLGVALTHAQVRTLLEAPENQLQCGAKMCYFLKLPCLVMKGGPMNGVDDVGMVLRRQRFVTCTSNGRDWSDNHDRPRKLNFEFIPEDVAGSFASATLVGSILGFEPSDSAVSAGLMVVHRILAEMRCERVITVKIFSRGGFWCFFVA